MERRESNKREDVFSKSVKAGKRTYFFDVKATRGNDYYLTITESKRRIEDNGKFTYEKHKLFLYKEDFEKFANGLESVFKFIRKEKGDDYGIEEGYYAAPVTEIPSTSNETETSATTSTDTPPTDDNYSSDISFDDLDDDDNL